MIGLAIPEEQEQRFRDDYAEWCAHKDVMNMLVSGTKRRDYLAPNVNVTTNTSNPIKAWIMVATFQDMNGTFGEFLQAYPRWDKYKE